MIIAEHQYCIKCALRFNLLCEVSATNSENQAAFCCCCVILIIRDVALRFSSPFLP